MLINQTKVTDKSPELILFMPVKIYRLETPFPFCMVHHFIIFLTTLSILQSKAVKAESVHAAGEVPERA